MRLDAVHRLLDHKRIGAVAAHQPMLAKQPNIARLAHRDRRRLGRIVRVRQPSILVKRQRRYFISVKTDQIEVEGKPLQLSNLDLEQVIIPARLQRELIVREHIGALLRSDQSAATMTGTSTKPSFLAASSRGWPAMRPPDSSTRTGNVQPHSRIDAAI